MLSRGGLPEVPCARCERRVVGLAWGELCPECRAERSGRAVPHRQSHLPRRDGADGAVRRLPLAPDPMARVYGAVAVLATYIIVRRIASRVAMESMK